MTALVLLMLASILAALAAHEAGHAIAAQAFRLPWKPVLTRHGPGISIGNDQLRLTRAQIAVTAAAGPAMSLMFAAAIWKLSPFAALASLELGVFNLLLPRSDGALLFRALMLSDRPVTRL